VDESVWSLDAVDASGRAVTARLALRPDERAAWFWAAVLEPERGPVVVRDHEVPMPTRSSPAVEIRSEALWAEFYCETADEHWSLGLEAFGVELDDPADAYSGELGHRTAVGWDIEWEVADQAGGRVAGVAGVAGSVGAVRGDVLLGADTIPFDGIGVLRRGEQSADWSRHASRAGWVAWDGAGRPPIEVVTDIELTPAVGALGHGTAGGARVDVTVLAVAPVPLFDDPHHRARFARIVAAVQHEGRSGIGWFELLAPE
jgi:hypothetical protein